tara:strand:- start:870 stop:1166 length:297 start_codon:yes stop_codon:yes gene_type:complete
MDAEIKRLMIRSLSKLSKLVEDFDDHVPKINELVDNNNISGLMLLIGSIRDSLAEVDFSLNECSSVAYGHHDYLMKQRISSLQDINLPESDTPTEDEK